MNDDAKANQLANVTDARLHNLKFQTADSETRDNEEFSESLAESVATLRLDISVLIPVLS